MDIFSVFYPSYFLGKIFGSSLFSIHGNQNHRKARTTYFDLLIFSCPTIIILAYFYYTCYDFFLLLPNNKLTMEIVIFCIIIFIYVFMMITNIIGNIFYRKNICNVLNNISYCNNYWKMLKINFNYPKLRNICIFFIIITFVLPVLVLRSEIKSYLERYEPNPGQFLAFLSVVGLSTELQLISILLLVYDLIKNINNKIKSTNEWSMVNVKLLVDAMEIHCQLFETSGNVNEMFILLLARVMALYSYLSYAAFSVAYYTELTDWTATSAQFFDMFCIMFCNASSVVIIIFLCVMITYEVCIFCDI